MQMLSRILFMYMAVQFLSKQFAANKAAPPLPDEQRFERPSAVQQLLGMDPAAAIPKFATHDADGNRLPPHRPVFSRNARVVGASLHERTGLPCVCVHHNVSVLSVAVVCCCCCCRCCCRNGWFWRGNNRTCTCT